MTYQDVYETVQKANLGASELTAQERGDNLSTLVPKRDDPNAVVKKTEVINRSDSMAHSQSR